MTAPSRTFFEEHAISMKVAAARPYTRYEMGDPNRLVREAWTQSPRFAAKIARQSAGLIINRYPPASLGLTQVPAELRPDTAVETNSHWHYHGDEQGGDLIIPTSGKRLPRRWIHTPDERRKHIDKKPPNGHGGVNDQTVHLDRNWAKYTFPPGDGAMRLDLHPEAWAKLANASRVFFVIEGCIKADAILSAGEAVFSVPSVTLWRAPEMAEFTKRHLHGRVVYIVPDADWFNNDKVMTQAMFCRTYLRRRGVIAHVASSPYEDYLNDPNIKAVDDFLAVGGKVDEMTVLERETQYQLTEWLAERRKWRRDKVARGEEVLESLAYHAGTNGQIRASLRSVARIMGMHHSRVERAARDLEDCGAITIDGSLATYARHYDKEKGWVGWDWEERPAITIHPDLRATDTQRPLGGKCAT